MKTTFYLIHRKAAALKYHTMWYYASKSLDLVLVAEFPKSGGTWVCQMLADYLDLPYPRNQIAPFKRSVLHSHNFYDKRFNDPVYVIRDGRDVMVSFYHHRYLGHNVIPDFILEKHRRSAPFKNFENVRENLPAFIEYIFTEFETVGKKTNWKNLTESYLDKDNVTLVKYEDLLVNPFLAMRNLLQSITGDEVKEDKLYATIEKFSFQNQSKRKPGEENKSSFLRKGVAQDWKNYFTKEACEVFDHYAGDLLVQLGYEKNRNWF